jgi:hypothetical protein
MQDFGVSVNGEMRVRMLLASGFFGGWLLSRVPKLTFSHMCRLSAKGMAVNSVSRNKWQHCSS